MPEVSRKHALHDMLHEYWPWDTYGTYMYSRQQRFGKKSGGSRAHDASGSISFGSDQEIDVGTRYVFEAHIRHHT